MTNGLNTEYNPKLTIDYDMSIYDSLPSSIRNELNYAKYKISANTALTLFNIVGEKGAVVAIRQMDVLQSGD